MGLAPAAANAAPYAPLNQPGPPLSVPQAALRASLYCEPSVRNAAVEPVLLNPATGVTPEENYSWNWEPALDKLGIPWCAYTAPNHTLNNIETSGEYLVYAIRTVYAMAHRKIAVMGHSQGGMSMRWPLRFWPDTRSMVDDVIGFSGSNHGTTVLSPALCAAGCPAADWQQGYDSNFIKALNSDAETFPGISYTEIYTHTDEVVQPNSGPNASAALHTGGGEITNVATQDICPSDVYEHLTVGTVDPVAYALAVDALTHPGPANPARIPNSVCSQTLMPGVNFADPNTLEQILDAQTDTRERDRREHGHGDQRGAGADIRALARLLRVRCLRRSAGADAENRLPRAAAGGAYSRERARGIQPRARSGRHRAARGACEADQQQRQRDLHRQAQAPLQGERVTPRLQLRDEDDPALDPVRPDAAVRFRRLGLPGGRMAERGALEHLQRQQRALHPRRGDVDPQQLQNERAIQCEELLDLHPLDLLGGHRGGGLGDRAAVALEAHVLDPLLGIDHRAEPSAHRRTAGSGRGTRDPPVRAPAPVG